MTHYRSVVIGVGGALPERVVTNFELAQTLDTSDEWITQRTGIKQRHIAAENETTSTLGLRAAQQALEQARVSADTVDLIICATSTPDKTFPATAAMIQRELGITQGAAFDVQAVCTGFVYALHLADALIKSGQHLRVLVIGAETYSRILDWSDRTTAVLFGDGAGAVVLERQIASDVQISNTQRGILASRIRSDGRYEDKLYVDGGPSTSGTTGVLKMEGKDVFKLAVGMVPAIIDDVLKDADMSIEDVDWFVPHQANQRIIQATADKLCLSMDKVILTVSEHANTSSASIPLALTKAVKERKIRENDIVLLEAMGGGFTWGAALMRW